MGDDFVEILLAGVFVFTDEAFQAGDEALSVPIDRPSSAIFNVDLVAPYPEKM